MKKSKEEIEKLAEGVPEKLGWRNDGTSEANDIKKAFILGYTACQESQTTEVKSEIDVYELAERIMGSESIEASVWLIKEYASQNGKFTDEDVRKLLQRFGHLVAIEHYKIGKESHGKMAVGGNMLYGLSRKIDKMIYSFLNSLNK